MTIALTNPPIPGRMPSPAAPKAVVMRFAGDSGDGIQLTGGQFALSTALAGNDLSTFPDFPAEIRAPARHDLWRVGLPDQFRLNVNQYRR